MRLRAGLGFLQQVGAVGEGLAELLLAAPAADLPVVAVEEDSGSAEAGELGGAGVVGVVEQAAGAVLGAGDALGISGDVGVGDAEALEFAARPRCRAHRGGGAWPRR